tara:strand:+ start:1217 stop:1459 length:243 start_codon:yes stop_codon:yes gene_type:complete
MKTLNIKTGADYKVTHKLTKSVQFMNAKELAAFVFKNDYKNYKIENTDKRFVDRIPGFLLYTSLIILIVSSVLLHIHLNY